MRDTYFSIAYFDGPSLGIGHSSSSGCCPCVIVAPFTLKGFLTFFFGGFPKRSVCGFLLFLWFSFGCSSRGLVWASCALVGSTGGEIGGAEQAMAQVMAIIRGVSVARKTRSTMLD
jgi:hypothetical protein